MTPLERASLASLLGATTGACAFFVGIPAVGLRFRRSTNPPRGWRRKAVLPLIMGLIGYTYVGGLDAIDQFGPRRSLLWYTVVEAAIFTLLSLVCLWAAHRWGERTKLVERRDQPGHPEDPVPVYTQQDINRAFLRGLGHLWSHGVHRFKAAAASLRGDTGRPLPPDDPDQGV